jgi:hypothetical protein
MPAAIPWTLIAVNVLAAVLLALAVAVYLRRLGAAPWYALIVGLTPGLYAAVSRDLTEPLAYALVACGLLALTVRRPHSQLVAGVLMGLAALTRESAVLFAVAAVVCIWIGRDELGRRVERNGQGAFFVGLLSIAPIVVLKGVLSLTVSGDSAPRIALLETTPFAGLTSHPEFGNLEKQQILAVAIPALVALAAVALYVRRISTPLLALYLNVVFLVILLPARAYEHVLTSSRITLGVPLAFVLCLPMVRGRGRVLLATSVPTAFWMLGWLSIDV